VTVCELLLATVTLPKFTGDGLMANRPCAPEPLRAMTYGPEGALLVRVMDPDTVAVEVGANTALNVLFVPAGRLIGRGRPVMLNPAPDTVACVIVRVELPGF
jgi:hypothetical protein